MRVEPELKENAHEWSLELKILSDETRCVFEETDKGLGLAEFKNVDDLFKKLGF